MIVLLVVLVLVVPLAHASPPDPLWIAGVYDAGDNDDALRAATAMEGSVPRDEAAVAPTRILAAVPPAIYPASQDTAWGDVQARAPPQTSSELIVTR